MKNKQIITGIGSILILFFILTVTQFAKKTGDEVLKNPVKMDQSSISIGKGIYFQYCAGCHGQRADGRGEQALNLLPKPQNLRNTSFINYLDDNRMYTSISGGVRGTAMPAFEMIIRKKDRWHLINYIRSITKKSLEKQVPGIEEKVPAKKLKNPIEANAESIASGHKLFDTYCLSCHGKGADGKGETALNLVPRPRNLTVITSWGEKPFINYLGDTRLYNSIAEGVSGTSMSPWKNVINEKGIWDIINYLRAEAKKGRTNYEQSYKE